MVVYNQLIIKSQVEPAKLDAIEAVPSMVLFQALETLKVAESKLAWGQ